MSLQGNFLKAEFIQSIDLFFNADDETCSSLATACIRVSLKAGEFLIEAGEAGTDLFLLQSGRLEVVLTNNAGAERVVRILHPGNSAGETSMLTGANRSASVRAAVDSELYCITQEQFDQIADSKPGFRATVERNIHHRIHGANLSAALYESQIFGNLDAQVVEDLHREIQLVPLKKGDRLITQGEASDSLFIIVSGQLRAFEQTNQSKSAAKGKSELDASSNREAQMRPVVDIGHGQTVGEIGFLSGEPRNASVFALRDTLVGRLSTDSYYRLLQKYPQELTRLFSSKILGRLVNPSKKKNRTFALIGINANGADQLLPVDVLAKRLCWHLENPWSGIETSGKKVTTAYIDEKVTDQRLGKWGISDSAIDSATHLQLQNWFAEMENHNEYLLFGAHYFSRSDTSNWLIRISQQVDHVIFVVNADADLSSVSLPRCFDNKSQELLLDPGCSLLLLHPEDRSMPKKTNHWLEKFNVDSHHHIRWSDREDSGWRDSVTGDIGRVSRLLTHQGVGLVLSGGAARGFAHIGVVRAMHEAGVPIDLFGGSSAGAISASIIASGRTDKEASDLVIKHGKRENLNDYTLPLTSLFNGKRLSRLLRCFVGDVHIEDLWNPFYCVSINLADASEVVHRRGLLWKYVRASASMPVLLPPVADEGRLLADGAMLNSMPVEIMSSDPGCGIVIGSDVSGGTGMRGEYIYGTELSGWRQLFRKFNPVTKPYKSPAFSSTILAISAIGAVGRLPAQRSHADLYIRPPVHKFRMMDYDSREDIMQAGYTAGKTEIAAWLKQKNAGNTNKPQDRTST